MISQIVPFKKLKNTRAWKLTSLYVRRKSKNVCYTCGNKYPISKLVAGHFIEKIGNAGTYFDMDNLRPQCQWYCNRMRHGAKDIYALKLIEELGDGIIKELHKRASKSKQWTQLELNVIVLEREKQLKELNGGS